MVRSLLLLAVLAPLLVSCKTPADDTTVISAGLKSQSIHALSVREFSTNGYTSDPTVLLCDGAPTFAFKGIVQSTNRVIVGVACLEQNGDVRIVSQGTSL